MPKGYKWKVQEKARKQFGNPGSLVLLLKKKKIFDDSMLINQ